MTSDLILFACAAHPLIGVLTYLCFYARWARTWAEFAKEIGIAICLGWIMPIIVLWLIVSSFSFWKKSTPWRKNDS